MTDKFIHIQLKKFFLCAGTLSFKGKNVILLLNNKTKEIVLPKGKVENNESLKDAALRETYEETGYACNILEEEPFCFTLRSNDLSSKVIFWFLAVVQGEMESNTQDIGEDFTTLECEPDHALEILTFESDKSVIRDFINRKKMI